MSDKISSLRSFSNRKELLESILNDDHLEREINKKINEISTLLNSGYQPETISKKLGLRKNEMNILYDFARARNSIKHKYSKYDQLYMDSYSASYSTPENVAMYRAQKLKGKNILDIGCGAGMASIFLSMYSTVKGYEMNEERVLMAKINNRKYSGKAIFEVGDGLKLQLKEKEYDLIYSDPLRSAGSRKRSLEELQPNPAHIMDIYRKKVVEFVFDLPPFLQPDRIKDIPGTLEYLSVDGNISRLTLYCNNNLRIFQATNLTHNFSYISEQIMKPNPGNRVMRYLFVPDASLFYSGLHGNYCNEFDLKIISEEKRKALYTGDETIQNFAGDTYEVLSVLDPDAVIEKLKTNNIGRVILRFDSPNYYEERRKIERNLDGEDIAYIFSFKERRIICRKIN